MKRDGHQQTGITRICNCKSPWSSSSSSSTSSAYPPPIGTTDEQWPQPPSAAGNSRTACARCHRPRPGVGGGGGAHHRRSATGPKSMGKVKGARKVRSCDVALNHRLVSWRVVDRGVDGMARAGVSASGIAGYLEGYHSEDDGEYDEEMEEAGAVGASDWYGSEAEMVCEIGEAGGGVDEGGPSAMGMEDDSGGGVGMIGETMDDMGFCEVGFVWDYVDEEDWCVVGEL